MPRRSSLSEESDAALSRDDGEAWTAALHRHIEKLERLTDLGLEAAELITGRIRAAAQNATEASTAAPRSVERLGLELARVSRAACLAMALQARLIAELRDPERATPRRPGVAPPGPAHPAANPERDRREVVEEAVESIAIATYPKDDDTVDRLVYAAKDSLRLDSRFSDLLNRPIAETIALICQDLGLEPDWPRLADKAMTHEAEARTHGDRPPPFRLVLVRPPPIADPVPAPVQAPAFATKHEPPPSAPPLSGPPPPAAWSPPHEGPYVLPGELPPPRRPRTRTTPY